jgi:ABC-type multidrug transport system ATPase subunit
MAENDPEKQSRLHSKVRREVPLVELCLENVTYAPITAGSRRAGRTTVCQNITTTIAPYKLTGWMGKSGSGKSSLCSVAAGLTQPGDLLPGSVITVNGEEGRIPKRLVGVVWQDDLLLSNLTVQENLYYAARLKTPEDTPDSVVRQTVEETMEELGLTHVRDSLVGNPTVAGLRGVSGGERKRVAVGAELVIRPSLLICDEPTSGLDSTTAYALIATLKELASIGHSIAVVIHQPRTTIFNLLDHLLLLSKGRTIFDGHPSQARSYLEACDFVEPLPPETGIADWIMDVITEDENRKDDSQLAEQWQKYSLTLASQEQKNDPHSSSMVLERRMSTLEELSSVPQYHTSFRKQMSLLTQRTSKQQRGERLTMASLVLQLTYLFFTSLFWWRMPNDTSSIFPRNSLLFFMLIAQSNGIVISAVTIFQRERALLSRERAKKMYTVSSYFLAKTVSDMTNNVLLPLLYSMIVYWTAGFRVSAKAYFSNIFAFYWTFSTAQSMGLFLSILIPNPQLALILAPPITLFFMIMGGFYIPFQNMHAGILWASYLSFARYGYSALV